MASPNPDQIQVAIVVHSGYGHTLKQAEAVAEGARAAGAAVTLLPVAELDSMEAPGWDSLDAADAIVMGAPTYMGSLSAPMKAFMDASSKKWFGKAWRDKIAAGFSNSGSSSGDKLNALVQLAVFAAQHGMVWVTLGLNPGEETAEESGPLNRLGGFLGAMAQSDVDKGPDLAPPAEDLATARHLGRRVAAAAARWRRGA